MARIATRDRAAFAALFGIVAPKVKGYLMRLGATGAAAEELTQDVMLTVWRKAEQFDPAKAGALTWIFVIARNRRIDALRRESSMTTYGLEAPEDMPDDSVDAPDAGLDGAEREARVRAAMQELSAEQQEVVRRSFFEEEPHAAIAAALALPLGTVKSRLRLAMAKLKAKLGDLK
ncbi:MAG: sigma-70 family RNA polymerase sigma factor [Hyphomonadaceae bacterium]|nr:sigma-70 family RNA polymerase sigma factor [Hyphomonadaceae bacterium]